MAAQVGDALGQPDPSGDTHEIGRKQFLQGQYVDAAESLAIACKANPKNEHWCDLLARARRNAITRYDLGSPPTERFDPDTLGEPPALHITAPSDVKELPPGPGLLRHLVGSINRILGVVLGAILGVVVRFVGRKGPAKTWEQWPKDRWFLLKDLRLASLRSYMNTHALQDPYQGCLVGLQEPGQKRPEWTRRYRTATGAWNTDNPMEGAAGTRFIWQGKDKIHAIRRNRLDDPHLPNPIAVSNLLFRCEGDRKFVPFLNLLTIGWIQFMVHDWLNHRQESDGVNGVIKVEIPKDDPRREKYKQDCMAFRRTQRPAIGDETLAFENEVTAWWDGSQIYGSDQDTQDKRRRNPRTNKFEPDGKIYVEPGDMLPLDPQTRVIESGFTRNMWVGLELFHTLFVKHHNYLCDQYRKEHQGWSGDQIFNQARLENAATMAKIHTIEWTPAVLPTKELAFGMSTNWHGMVETKFKRFENRRPLGWIEPTHPMLGGVLGGVPNNFGVPQNFSEQFAEVYRLHAGMPDAIEIRNIGQEEKTAAVETDVTRAAGSRRTLNDFGIATVINSFGHQHMPALVNNNYPRFMTDMSTEGSPVFDLAAADIIRARERGVPPFNEFRRQLGMPGIKSFADLGCDQQTVRRLEDLYGQGEDGVNRMDLAVGMYCDTNRPLHGFDQTRFAIFLQSATRRLQTDPFYTEKYNERYYTKAGLKRIDKATLKCLLLRHYPELKGSGLTRLNNAFEPWGTTADTHPDEHPLTAHAERYRTKHPRSNACDA